MSALGQKQTWRFKIAMSALPPKADMCGATGDVRFGPIADTVPSKSCLKSKGSHDYAVRRRNGLFFDRNETPSIVRFTPFSYLVGLPDVYGAFILIAHADRQTTSQGFELRPYNWDISVEGERWQSRSCWRCSRRKKWEGLSSNSHWWSTLFGKPPCLALYDRQVAELRNQLYQR